MITQYLERWLCTQQNYTLGLASSVRMWDESAKPVCWRYDLAFVNLTWCSWVLLIGKDAWEQAEQQRVAGATERLMLRVHQLLLTWSKCLWGRCNFSLALFTISREKTPFHVVVSFCFWSKNVWNLWFKSLKCVSFRYFEVAVRRWRPKT